MFWKLNGRSAVIVQTLFQLEWYALAVAIYYYYLHFDDCLPLLFSNLGDLFAKLTSARHFSYSTECLSRNIDLQFFPSKNEWKIMQINFLSQHFRSNTAQVQ